MRLPHRSLRLRFSPRSRFSQRSLHLLGRILCFELCNLGLRFSTRLRLPHRSLRLLGRILCFELCNLRRILRFELRNLLLRLFPRGPFRLLLRAS